MPVQGLLQRCQKDDKIAHILCVDDNDTCLDVLEEYLLATGLEPVIHKAHSGSEAFEKAKEAISSGHPFDVAIVDMNMPGMTGMQTARLFAEELESAAPAIILLAYPCERPCIEEATAAGVLAIESKPLAFAKVIYAVIGAMHGEKRGCSPLEQFIQPMNKPRKKPQALSSANGSPSGPKLKVLVADDNNVNRQVAQLFLSRLGHSSVLAQNGAQAIEAVRNSGMMIEYYGNL